MKVLVADPIADKGIELLKANVETDVAIGLTKELLVERIGAYDALITRSETKATAEVIKAGKNLKVIGRAGVGVDNIDVEAATEAGILVVNVPGANTISAAEHAFGLMLALSRLIPQADADLRKDQWKRSKFVGVEVYRKTLGLLGLGRIGTEVAVRAKAFGMEVVAYDPYVSRERAALIGVKMGDLETVLADADYISLHMAKTKETANLLNRDRLLKAKKGVRIVNCARGGIIDEDALCDLLQSGQVGGAALDVFAEEPPKSHNKLFDLPNVIVTPHLAGSTVEAQENNGVSVAEMVLTALSGEPVLSAVNLPSVAPEEAKAVAPFLPVARVLGQFAAQAWPGGIDSIEVDVSGELAGGPVSLLTNNAIIGLLSAHLEDQVNLINARPIAKKRGIQVFESQSTRTEDFTNQITLRVRMGDQKRSVSGHLSAQGPRIVAINDHPADFFPTPWMIVVEHNDRPGMIGKVGTLLGSADINIAGMQVARASARGAAVMILQLDEEPGEDVLNQVRRIEGMVTARKIMFPELAK